MKGEDIRLVVAAMLLVVLLALYSDLNPGKIPELARKGQAWLTDSLWNAQ
jgi:hypothetical protein